MAGTDPQKHLLTLIRDFASEKSQGERRVIGLKKQNEELRSELEAANAELAYAKRAKETAEQELKGYEVEHALNENSIQTLEARISLIQEEVSAVGSDLEALKDNGGALRDEFISQMFDLNAKLRDSRKHRRNCVTEGKFQVAITSNVHHKISVGTAAGTEGVLAVSEAEHKHMEEVPEVDLKTLEQTLAHIVCQTTKEEEEYQAEQNLQKQVQQEFVDYEKKVSLMEVILKATKALQEITRQTSELEVTCASLGEELQRRCVCPTCHLDNVEALGEFLQGELTFRIGALMVGRMVRIATIPVLVDLTDLPA